MRNTSIRRALHIRTYLAQVAPPYPPPITITRPIGFGGVAGSVAQPERMPGVAAAAALAPIALMNSRRLKSFVICASSPRLLRRIERRDRVDLLLGQPFRDLMHDRRRALAVAEIAELQDEIVLRLTEIGRASCRERL